MRDTFGRFACSLLGALYTAGAVPLFSFGETGAKIWNMFEQHVTAIADAVGISSWLALALLGPLTVGSPLALVWLIAGNGITRPFWFLAGIAAYGAYWMFG